MTELSSNIPLEQEYLKRQAPGTLQRRAFTMIEQLSETNGAPLVDAAAKIGRHTAELAARIVNKGLPIVRSYDDCVPIFGKASEIARQGTVMSPAEMLAVTKLS